MANRYYRHSRLSESVFRRLVRSFAEDKTAAETAVETNLDRKSVTNIFLRIRRRLLEASVKNRPQLTLSGFKVKELYFVAESEAECRKYAAQYQSRVLVVVFESGLVRADLIYAESEQVFDKLKNLPNLKHRRVDDFGFYDVIGKLPRRIIGTPGLTDGSIRKITAAIYCFTCSGGQRSSKGSRRRNSSCI